MKEFFLIVVELPQVVLHLAFSSPFACDACNHKRQYYCAIT